MSYNLSCLPWSLPICIADPTHPCGPTPMWRDNSLHSEPLQASYHIHLPLGVLRRLRVANWLQHTPKQGRSTKLAQKGVTGERWGGHVHLWKGISVGERGLFKQYLLIKKGQHCKGRSRQNVCMNVIWCIHDPHVLANLENYYSNRYTVAYIRLSIR